MIYCYIIDRNCEPIKFKLVIDNDKLIITNAFEQIIMLYLSNEKYFESNKHIELIQTWNNMYPELSVNF